MSAIGILSLLLLVSHLQPGLTHFLDWECGLRSDPVPYAPRIVNGSDAKMTSSPWMAFILTTNDFFICSGTLITNRFVLTAAHCYYKHRNLKVVLGEYNTGSKDTCYYNVHHDLYCNTRVELNVDLGFMHPNFNLKPLDNDIAILRLARRVEYRENIKPICIVLDKSWRNYIDGMDSLTATGWGLTFPNGKPSKVLQTVKLRRQFPEICTQYAGKTPLHNEFCVGAWKSGVCNGDSGGPIGKLIAYGEKPRFIQVGVASLTNQRCKYASIFTDVLSHVDWILSVEERYSHGYTQPKQVRPPNRRNPNRYIPR